MGVACMLSSVFGLNSGTGRVVRRLGGRKKGREGRRGERREEEKERRQREGRREKARP